MPETLQMAALRRKIGKKTVGVRLSSKTHFLHPDYMQNITLNTLVIRTKLRRSMIGANRFLSAQKASLTAIDIAAHILALKTLRCWPLK
ncbi:MAG: hypothetical protein O2921_03765 [Chloroflexi bacterium]|nr:hypothetical protein [Chloroflexota bacterium]MDA1281728.1 hypothetical protein [Chloroflexota bacterium]